MSRSFSVFISRFLNDLGYSENRVKLRHKTFEKLSYDFGDRINIFCGSKSEGITLLYENDFDVMTVITSSECRETFDDYSSNSGLIKFQLMGVNSTPAGYALLKCISLNNTALSDHVHRCLVEVETGTYLLSSDSWRHIGKENMRTSSSSPENDGIITTSRDSQGPSCSSQLLGDFMSVDNVGAIRCHSPQLIASWKNTRRLHDWPSPELIDTVSSLEAHVVPIGYKDSPLHFLEWRICFTKAEIRLIESLNDSQTKLIILLKMIAKHVLKPVCKEMTSYVMKNLVLWMAEKYPSKTFVEDKLLVLLKHSLKLLKSCIMNKKLPSYMIEERNLFADRISDNQGNKLHEKIEMLLIEGPNMLLRIPNILNGLNLFRVSPDQFFLLSEKKALLESVLLNKDLSNCHIINAWIRSHPSPTIHGLLCNIIDLDYVMCVMDIVLPDTLDILARDGNIEQIFLERMRYLLS